MTRLATSGRFGFLVIAWLIMHADRVRADDPFVTEVFKSGTGGYHTYRIPSLLVTPKGTVLAFCEGRKTGHADHGDIDLLLRTSTDGGRTWGPVQIVYEEGGTEPLTIGNPCPVVDRDTGTVVLTFCRNNRDVLVTSSRDEGRTWSTPRFVTSSVKKDGWQWYATGPGVGIQLEHGSRRGRLVIPCDHDEVVDGSRAMHSHVIYSDDHGQTWELGGTVGPNTDECQVVELADGELLINMRNDWGRKGSHKELGGKRMISRSRDGGRTWAKPEFDETLIEPVCQASLIRVQAEEPPLKPLLLFSNPASTRSRRGMTLRASRDEGRSWPIALPVDAGFSAYSCLAALPDRRIGLLYEQGNAAQIVFAVFSLSDILQGSGRGATPRVGTPGSPSK
ncbi:sialidase family protein [Singulisphaera rosea]